MKSLDRGTTSFSRAGRASPMPRTGTAIWILVVAFVFMTVGTGCGRECAEPLVDQFSKSQFTPESWLIDMGWSDARQFLISGWSEDEAWGAAGFLFVWGTGPSSVVRMQRYGDADVRLRFRCAPNEFPERGRQAVTTVVNGIPVATTRLRSGFANYEFTIPASVLRHGENLVELRYRYSGRPAIQGSTDTRDLAVAWDWIEVLEPRAKPHVRLARTTDDSIVIPYRSAVWFPIEVDPGSALVADAIEIDGAADPQSTGKVLLSVFSNDRRAKANMTVAPRGGTVRFQFPDELRGRCTLEFIVLEPKDGAPASALGVTLRNPRIVRRHCR